MIAMLRKFFIDMICTAWAPKGRDYNGNFKNCYGSFQSAHNR